MDEIAGWQNVEDTSPQAVWWVRLRDGTELETPEERDVWHLWGMDWIEPEKRNGVPVGA